MVPPPPHPRPLLPHVPPRGPLRPTDVENFPGFPEGILGVELTGRMREQSERCGAAIYTETVAKVDLSKRPFKVRGCSGPGGFPNSAQRGRA
jgi:thioredoxin reductase